MFGKAVEIFTDGGVRNNQSSKNIGGWGAVIKQGENTVEIYGNSINSTNNKMELTAVIEALKTIKSTNIPITIYSDSKYIIDSINKKWLDSWIKRGWLKSNKEPVLNKDLWEQIVELKNRQDKIEFVWVRGHADNEGNNLADELANKGMDEIENKKS